MKRFKGGASYKTFGNLCYCRLIRIIELTLAAGTQAEVQKKKCLAKIPCRLFQLRKHCAELRSVFVCASSLNFLLFVFYEGQCYSPE
jgi:hypothetical protein